MYTKFHPLNGVNYKAVFAGILKLTACGRLVAVYA